MSPEELADYVERQQYATPVDREAAAALRRLGRLERVLASFRSVEVSMWDNAEGPTLVGSARAHGLPRSLPPRIVRSEGDTLLAALLALADALEAGDG